MLAGIVGFRIIVMAAKAREAKVNYLDETTWGQQGVLAWL
jgi:hypothetical protein